MDHSVTALERAFQLAKSGSYASVALIKKQLHAEGYSLSQITGGALSKQLVGLIKAASASPLAGAGTARSVPRRSASREPMPVALEGATIVFDLDGTLVDTAPDLAAATNHALGIAGLQPVSVAELHPFIGHGSRAMIDAGLLTHGVTVPDKELTRLHDQFLAFYADNVAVGSRPFEGIPELLDALVARGARLAVCTNKIERLSKLLLRDLGLDARFVAIAGRDTFDVCKPAPGHLTATIAMAGGQVGHSVMVGDSEIDFATAMAAGVPSIGVTFGYTPRPVHELGPGVVIDHYRDFMPALENILALR